MDLKPQLRKKMVRKFSAFVEVKNGVVPEWWDGLTTMKRMTVCNALGLSKSDSKKSFNGLSRSIQFEIDTFYFKNSGKVEQINRFGAFRVLNENRKG